MLVISLAVLIAAAAGFALAWAVRSRVTGTMEPQSSATRSTRFPNDQKASESGELKIGRFHIAPDKLLLGELRIAGSESLLTLRDDDIFHVDRDPKLHLTGTLYDQTKITLADCIRLRTHAKTSSGAVA
jgi:hypothetical protein